MATNKTIRHHKSILSRSGADIQSTENTCKVVIDEVFSSQCSLLEAFIIAEYWECSDIINHAHEIFNRAIKITELQTTYDEELVG